MSDTYYQKYLKYKNKYLSLKSEVEGGMRAQSSRRLSPRETSTIRLHNKIIGLFNGITERKITSPEQVKAELVKIKQLAEMENRETQKEVSELINTVQYYIEDGKFQQNEIDELIKLTYEYRQEVMELKQERLSKAFQTDSNNQKSKSEIKQAKEEVMELKKERLSKAFQTDSNNQKSQGEIKQLEQENEKLRNQQKRVNDAINRLTDFFRNRIVTPAPAVLVR